MASDTPATQPNDPLNHRRIFAALRDALADLYPIEQDANIIVHDAGLIAREITFSSRAKTNWQNILTAALQQQRLDLLLEVVRRDYLNNPALQIAYSAYRHLVEQGETLTSSIQLEDADVMQAFSTSASTLLTDSTLNSSINVIGRDHINTAGDVVYGDKFGGARTYAVLFGFDKLSRRALRKS